MNLFAGAKIAEFCHISYIQVFFFLIGSRALFKT